MNCRYLLLSNEKLAFCPCEFGHGTLYNSNWKLSLAEGTDKPGHRSAAAALQLCSVQYNALNVVRRSYRKPSVEVITTLLK